MSDTRAYDTYSREDLIRLLRERDTDEAGGLRLHYKGQTPPWRIVRRVQPRAQKIEEKLSCGSEADRTNLILEGENLQGMVSLYKYRGQIDLVLTDPPYNTGDDFRYNDKWDEDPNDPDLGSIVPAEDGSKHSKWLRFMSPRLWMMYEMLKPGGVLAICIDHRELFRLGMLLDEMFGENNRLGIINWQKTTVKNDKKHVSSTTEYVLVYAKKQERAKTGLLERSAKADARFGNPDNDLNGEWKQDNPAAQGQATHPTMVYAIQSPFTGALHYPPSGRHWQNEKRRVKAWLDAWGPTYVERNLGDGRAKALVIKGALVEIDAMFNADSPALLAARKLADEKLAAGNWPQLYFGMSGRTKPVLKVYMSEVKGSVPTTFWVDEGEDALELGTVSWSSTESGRSREGIEELDAVMGPGHNFKTVKPLKLFRKIIQIWCPQNGIVLDPFAGSGTSGHAVLEANVETGSQRTFLLIEQGRPERGDSYARGLTAERVRRVITGVRADKSGNLAVTADPLGSGFRFAKLTQRVMREGVLALEREEMIDLLLTSHWDHGDRAASYLRRLPAGDYKHLFAVSSRNEGFFLAWNGPKGPAVIDRPTYRAIVDEAQGAGLAPPFHVYARTMTYSGPHVEFYQIPDRILEKLGFNEALHPYSNPSDGEEDKPEGKAA